ncbi:ABC transporter substrate-binding protein [Halovibrio variabilis]|uniref:ABC transporter substrate-binding protein n=1 Tax=Halovibrio variabilis TaxID=31910 RepID=A0A511UUD8_9GAMM|nr:ABC transporter substrate-binding protein [Halovibrio variabilis]GEN29133.1 ABC transporter substrate-binding protein [Halovibrio variabilis]
MLDGRSINTISWFALVIATILTSFPVWSQQVREAGTVATLDFAIAETLFAVQDLPVAMGGVSNYQSWTEDDSLPPNLVDIGSNPQPNKELLSTLNLNTILIPLQYAYLKDDLSSIAPVAQLSPYNTSPLSGWEKMIAFTKEIGTHTERKPEVHQLIANADDRMNHLRDTATTLPQPLLLMQFLDTRHVRVYGRNSLPGIILEQLGLRNAWDGPSSRWGISTIGIGELFNMEAHFVVVDTSHLPSRRTTQENVMASELWGQLPSVRAGNTTLLDADFWVFGAIPSAILFADSLINAFESK